MTERTPYSFKASTLARHIKTSSTSYEDHQPGKDCFIEPFLSLLSSAGCCSIFVWWFGQEMALGMGGNSCWYFGLCGRNLSSFLERALMSRHSCCYRCLEDFNFKNTSWVETLWCSSANLRCCWSGDPSPKGNQTSNPRLSRWCYSISAYSEKQLKHCKDHSQWDFFARYQYCALKSISTFSWSLVK